MDSLRIPLLLTFAASLISLAPGCRREMSCESIAKRNAACTDAFVHYAKEQVRPRYEQAIAQMPENERPRAKRRLAHRFAVAAKGIREEMSSDRFLKECRADWNDHEKFPEAQKKKLRECMKAKDCNTYASCFMEAAKLSHKPR